MPKSKSKSKGKFRRARLRHAIFTRGADKLLGGRLLERHLVDEIHVRSFDVAVPNWRSEFDGLRIGHVSDLHLGDLMPPERANKAIQLLASHEVDLVAFTGDAVDLHWKGVESFFESLVSVPAPLG